MCTTKFYTKAFLFFVLTGAAELVAMEQCIHPTDWQNYSNSVMPTFEQQIDEFKRLFDNAVEKNDLVWACEYFAQMDDLCKEMSACLPPRQLFEASKELQKLEVSEK